MKRIPIILGPTSSGKTSLAIDLCKKFSGRIISADSRQIFKKMNIGTGKVPVGGSMEVKNFMTYWTLNEVIVYGYDLSEPNVYFSADDYTLWGQKKLLELAETDASKNIFIVGGTGFYIDLLTGNAKTAKVSPNFELRNELALLNVEELGKKLYELSPEKFEKIDQKNRARLMRAIEIEVSIASTDKLEGDSNKNNFSNPNQISNEETTELSNKIKEKFEFFYVGLTAPREVLYSRADNWVEQIWANGLLEEVRELKNLGFDNTLSMRGLLYRTALEFLDGGISAEDAKLRIKFDIHAYIRRQTTWFRRNKDIVWFDITDPNFFQKVSNHVQSKIDG